MLKKSGIVFTFGFLLILLSLGKAGAYSRDVRFVNHTAHALFFSVNCDAGVHHDAPDTYTLPSDGVFKDKVSYNAHTHHHKRHAFCRFLIAPSPVEPFYVRVLLSPSKGHCRFIQSAVHQYGKRVKCNNRLDTSDAFISPGASPDLISALFLLWDIGVAVADATLADRVITLSEKQKK